MSEPPTKKTQIKNSKAKNLTQTNPNKSTNQATQLSAHNRRTQNQTTKLKHPNIKAPN